MTSTCADETYARTAALGMLASLDYYQRRSPAVGDGRMATPAYYANRLGKVLAARGDTLPGDGYWWWADRYAAYAQQILGVQS